MNDALLQDLLDHVRQRFYGKYRGVVTDVDAATMRIKASVPSVLPGAPTGWCAPCVPYAGPQVGFLMLPEIGSGVWIEFEGGETGHDHAAPARTMRGDARPHLAIVPIVGNQARLRALPRTAPRVQPKLEIGATNDPLEHEADQVADRVMRMAAPALAFTPGPAQLSRKCAQCEDEKTQTLRNMPAGSLRATASEAPAIVTDALRSPGRALESSARNFLEPRFGFDLGGVRIHTDATAAAAARAVGARAFTLGREIVFASNEYRPAGVAGRQLLAHELAHVLQQADALGAPIRRTPADSAEPASAAEANGLGQAPAPTPAQDPPMSEPALPDQAQTESASPDSGPPELSALAAKVEQLKAVIAAVTRDQGPAPPQGRTEIGGETVCDPDTGKPRWAINRGVVPQCMWPCAEIHEQTHAEFMAQPCEDVGIAFARITFWLHVAKQYAKENKPDDVERAIKQLETAIQEATQAVERYKKYMDQTCRYDEGAAYDAGIKACDTDDARKRCTAAGQNDQYVTQMAAWRRFMQNPPNCLTPQHP